MAVIGLVGRPGSGKTLRAVELALAALASERDVFANFRLGKRVQGILAPTCVADGCTVNGLHTSERAHDTAYTAVESTPLLTYLARRYSWPTGEVFVPDPNAYLLTSWDQVMAIRVWRDELGRAHRLRLVKRDPTDDDPSTWTTERTCAVWDCPGCSKGITLVFDELNLWAPSRLWTALGLGVLNRWAYVRKDGLDVIWTAQHEARVDKVAREVTDNVWSCQSYGGLVTLFGWQFRMQLFVRRKWELAMLTDKNRLAEGEGAKGAGITAVDVSFYHPEIASRYDTFEHVADSGHLSGAGKRARLRAVKTAKADEEADEGAA